MPETHKILGGKVNVYRRENSDRWQCSTFLAGRNRRKSTKEESLSKAKDVAEDWYFSLLGMHRSGELKNEKTFKDASDAFLREFEIITQGQRSPAYVAGQRRRIENHLLPFFGHMGLSTITAGTVQDYRIHRMKARMEAVEKVLARNTLHQEIVALRQALKTAKRHGWLEHLPDLSQPYGASGKISHRAWFSPDEYKQLYTATRTRAKSPKNNRYRWECEQLHDFVLFMVNTGLRPDEALRLEFRDVTIVADEPTGETILEIEVRGKRGIGYCKSTKGAVLPFQRIEKRLRRRRIEEVDASGPPGATKARVEWYKPEQTDRLFPSWQRELFRDILLEEKLKTDRDGRARTAYSLRHTYICLRLMEGADIYQVAKNCRTSVEMIEKYYAAHLKDRLDAAAINVRKRRRKHQLVVAIPAEESAA